mmetsp:Transcript_23911/g.50694  ORF Transcript_23911/g.50694 Transcript_23911/m.50694 type:complete len:218 (-) Transcript_23911:49-702(-)
MRGLSLAQLVPKLSADIGRCLSVLDRLLRGIKDEGRLSQHAQGNSLQLLVPERLEHAERLCRHLQGSIELVLASTSAHDLVLSHCEHHGCLASLVPCCLELRELVLRKLHRIVRLRALELGRKAVGVAEEAQCVRYLCARINGLESLESIRGGLDALLGILLVQMLLRRCGKHSGLALLVRVGRVVSHVGIHSDAAISATGQAPLTRHLQLRRKRGA